jgi:hypothetical protein
MLFVSNLTLHLLIRSVPVINTELAQTSILRQTITESLIHSINQSNNFVGVDMTCQVVRNNGRCVTLEDGMERPKTSRTRPVRTVTTPRHDHLDWHCALLTMRCRVLVTRQGRQMTHTHTHTHTPAQTLCLNKTSDRIRVCAVPPQTTTTLSRYPDAKRILFLHVISLVFWREYLDLRGIRTSFIIYTLQQMLLEWWNKGDCGEGHVARMGRWVMRIIFWSESLKGRDQLGDLDVDVRIILELISEKYVKILWTGLIWHSIGTGGGLLRTRNWTFEFSKMWGISWLA